MRRFVFVLMFIAGYGNDLVTQQSGAAACITADACGIPLYPNGPPGVTACVQLISLINNPEHALALRLTPSQADCVAAAGSNCAAAKRCLAGGNTPKACPTVQQSCDGSTWTYCLSAFGSGGGFGERTFDCAAYGQLCIAKAGYADCGVGSCEPDVGSCVMADGSPGGNFVTGCYGGGTLKLRDCGRLAASCIPPGSTTVAHCRGNGAACTAPAGGADDTIGCEGNVLLHCLDGQVGREDCGQYKLACLPRLSGGGYACLAGSDCDPYMTSATCAGESLTFCDNGKMLTVDCGAIGFATCNPNNGGSCGM